jgi:hypothetical protein
MTTATKPRKERIVVVTTPTGKRYVRALSKVGAIGHVVAKTHAAEWATADDMIGVAPESIETAEAKE